MSRRSRWPAVLVLVALAAVARNGTAQVGGAPGQPTVVRGAAPAADRAADAQKIRALSQQWLAAERKGDVEGVMANYASDAVAVYGGQLLTGVAAIRRNLEQDLATFPKERPGYVPSWQTTAVEVAQAGDMAYESGTYDDSWNGGKNHERGNYLTVWRKVGNQWKVARDMAAPEAAPRPTTKPGP